MLELSKEEFDFVYDLVRSEKLRSEALRGTFDDFLVDRLQKRNQSVLDSLEKSTKLDEKHFFFVKSLIASEFDRMDHYRNEIDGKIYERLRKFYNDLSAKLKVPTTFVN